MSLNLPVGMLSELLYADDLVLMSVTMEGVKNKFLKWKEAFEIKDVKVIIGKTKVIVSGGITKDGMSKSNVYQFEVCCLRVKANSILCTQCGKWINGRYAGVITVTPKY